MKKIVTILFLFSLISTAACADEDKPIVIGQLPAQSQEFISTYFADSQTAFVKIDHDFLVKDYEVIFVDGTQLTFNGKGIWQKIDCQRKAVPAELIPAKIASQVASLWNENFITEIEKDRRQFDVTLNNGIELTFDSNFNIIDYDN